LQESLAEAGVFGALGPGHIHGTVSRAVDACRTDFERRGVEPKHPARCRSRNQGLTVDRDFTPAATPGRMLAVAEALLGQLCLITVVALVVGPVRARHP
jgi:hypothetical protein